MAQTGYTPILIYSSTTAAQAPSAGNLTNSTLGSELAINITDGKLFYKDNANAVQVIAWKTTPTTAGGTGLTSYTAGDLPYYAAGTALSKLGIGAANTVLTSSGTAPQWTAQSSLSVGTASNLLSNATTGVMQIVGPGAGTTRVMTIPNANFTAARTDAAQSFTGVQTFGNATGQNSVFNVVVGSGGANQGVVLVTGATGKGWYGFNKANDSQIPGQFTYDFNTNVMNLFSSGSITFTTNASGTSTTLDTSGNLKIENGNLIVGTSGKGIDFSATPGTGTSELLADYEEGTWTPTIFGGTTAGTASYGVAVGRYTKIGRQVSVQAHIEWSSATGTGNVRFGGLPFTSLTGSNGEASVTIGWFNNYDLTANNVATGFGFPGTTNITLQQYQTGGSASAGVPIDAAGGIMFSMTYFVD